MRYCSLQRPPGRQENGDSWAGSRDQSQICAPVQNRATVRRMSGALQRSKSSPPPDLVFVIYCVDGMVLGTLEGCTRWRFMDVCGGRFDSRVMVRVLGNEQMRQQRWSGKSTFNRPRWCRCLDEHVTTSCMPSSIEHVGSPYSWKECAQESQRHLRPICAARRHASIRTTGDVYVQTIEKSVLSAMNSRTLETLADWKPAILNGKVTAINGAAPKWTAR